ncbi:MAG: HAD family hydrolase [Spirochaetae bacterium HGW-Spirochaetae-7]|jgi:phosphoglycolate phosphatase/putative hydrolase of the HAD superfamily|nr:MAG: HAD family hydrolase [Spirochaetae bacterium HGW-Spirochaetae-7]
MTIYRIPERIGAFLFDIDGTMYTNAAYGRFQSEILIAELARILGVPFESAAAEVKRVQAEYAAAHGGASTSLGNSMATLGIDMAASVELRSRLIDPSLFLAADPELRRALAALRAGPPGGGNSTSLLAVTNNPRSVGEATLAALGVLDLFLRVIGLDDTMLSKPAREPYLLAASIAKRDTAACVSVGDRYDVDLAVPLELGMGAVLVSGAEDVYALPAALASLYRSPKK